jgi:hypothetical protein
MLHVVRNTSGSAWTSTPIAGALPAVQLTNSLAADPLSPGRVYIGTRHGLWVGTPNTAGVYTWAEDPNVPETLIIDIENQRDSHGYSGVIRLATYGRGVYETVPTLPAAAAVTISVPTRTITTASNVYLATTVQRSPALAVVTGSLAIRSLSGEEHAHCALTIGPLWSAGRVVGAFDQAGTGANLPSTGYGTDGFAITGSYAATTGDVLALRCTTSGANDAILLNTHVVIKQLATQAS